MATVNLGRVGLVLKGDWVETEPYVALDVVSHDGNSWAAKRANTNVEPTTENDDDWQLISNNADLVATVQGYKEDAAASAEAAAESAEDAAASAEKGQEAQDMIAPTEESSTASAAHAAGSYFIYGGDLYRATADIARGGTITPNTNCKAATLGGDVGELKSALNAFDITATATDVGKALKAKTVSNGKVTEYELGDAAVIDPTLSVSGEAADAKATGDAISSLQGAISEQQEELEAAKSESRIVISKSVSGTEINITDGIEHTLKGMSVKGASSQASTPTIDGEAVPVSSVDSVNIAISDEFNHSQNVAYSDLHLRAAGDNADLLDVLQGKVTRQIKSFTINGTERFARFRSDEQNRGMIALSDIAGQPDWKTGTTGYCTRIPYDEKAWSATGSGNDVFSVCFGGNWVVFKFGSESTINTEALAKAWFAENTPTFYYVSQTPVDEDVTAYPNLKSYNFITNIVSDADVNAEYYTDDRTSVEAVYDLQDQIDNIVTVYPSLNIFDYTKAIKGAYVSNGTYRTDGSYGSYTTSDYMLVDPGDYVVFTGEANRGFGYSIWQFDLEKGWVGSLASSSDNVRAFDFTVNKKCYIRVTFSISISTSFIPNMMVALGRAETLPAFSRYQPRPVLNPNIDASALVEIATKMNHLYGKKYIAYGDSYTEWSDASYTSGRYAGSMITYDREIRLRNDMSGDNRGLSGSVLALPNGDDDPTDWLRPFSNGHYMDVDADCDYLTIAYGINDVSRSVLGQLGDTTNKTFYGAWHVVLSWLIEHRPNMKIGILIFQRQGQVNDQFYVATIESAQKYGIPVLDFYGDINTPVLVDGKRPSLGLSPEIAALRRAHFGGVGNPSHPGHLAHEYESACIEEFLRRL